MAIFPLEFRDADIAASDLAPPPVTANSTFCFHRLLSKKRALYQIVDPVLFAHESVARLAPTMNRCPRDYPAQPRVVNADLCQPLGLR